jgi:hypothetical protein
MPPHRKPNILVVDDEPDLQRARRQELEPKAFVQVKHPSEVRLSDLKKADLVLVDYVIEHWPERAQLAELATRPQDGLALAAVLRSHLSQSPKPLSQPAFALYSAKLEELAGAPREHSIARANNLDWAFPKTQGHGETPLGDQILSLANAVRRLPSEWSYSDENPDSAWRTVKRLLALRPKTSWESQAVEDIEGCFPPIFRLSQGTHGREFLRWFLQRILPYPCFLWDITYLSARIRVSRDSLDEALKRSKKLSALVGRYAYEGILCDFLGQRWWRAGVENFLWKLTKGNSGDRRRVLDGLNEVSGIALKEIEETQPVVCVDEDYRFLDHLVDISDAVRIQPEEWPPFADQAWTSIKLAKEHPSLRAIVLNQDRARLT